MILKKRPEYDVYGARSEVIRSVLLSMISKWIYGHLSIMNINNITVIGKSKLCVENLKDGVRVLRFRFKGLKSQFSVDYPD